MLLGLVNLDKELAAETYPKVLEQAGQAANSG